MPDFNEDFFEHLFWFPPRFSLIYFLFYEELSKMFSYTHAGLHVKYPLFLSDFNETWIFSTFLEKYSVIFMKIRPVGSELFQAEQKCLLLHSV